MLYDNIAVCLLGIKMIYSKLCNGKYNDYANKVNDMMDEILRV